jgi:ABC-type branched-subunit amino acid transport system ATPase component
MRQRLGLAEILVKQAQIAILDEPTAALDPHSTQEFLQLIRRLKAAGVTVLLVEQNLHLALALCDYAYVIAEGRPFLEGPCAEVAAKPEIRQAYLGL